MHVYVKNDHGVKILCKKKKGIDHYPNIIFGAVEY